MRRAVVCGGGGFIGEHLAKKLKRKGYCVRGMDIREHEFTRRRPMISGCLICESRMTAGRR
jgi:nucleoside-diphosphate-sugar epimerase